MDLSRAYVLEAARRRRPEFERASAAVAFEPLGILYSEGLFLQAALDRWTPGRIVESGRARGQSTHLLAASFPGVRVVSVELDPTSPHAAVARERLAGFPDVELLFGDSRRELPRLVRPGDAVVIDGPKGFRGLKLAMRLLAEREPAAVFVHDCHVGSEEREFLDRRVPHVLYSDDAEFEKEHAELDARCFVRRDDAYAKGWRPHWFQGSPQTSYGPTYACIPRVEGVPYRRILRAAITGGVIANVRRSLRKRGFGSTIAAS